MKRIALVVLLSLLWAPVAPADDAVQLTDYPEDDWTPAWSPDGTEVAFSHGTIYDADIWAKSVTGGAVRTVVMMTGAEREPAWSPDGAQIAFVRSGTIWTAPVSGGAPVEITDYTTDLQADWRPAWSPDGTTIAFHTRLNDDDPMDIFTVLAGGGPKTQITTSGGGHETPCWSRSGDSIVFSWLSGAAYAYEVDVGTGIERDLAPGVADCLQPALSPWGTWLAYSNGADIMVVQIGGGTPVQVTDDPGIDRYPTWSPDGTQIAFESTRSGNRDIWVIDAPTVGITETSWGAIKARYRD